MRRGPTVLAPSPLPPPSPLPGEGGGEGALVRDGLTLSFRLVPSCHSRRYSSGIQGRGEGDRRTRRSLNLLRSLHHEAEKKTLDSRLKLAGMTGGEAFFLPLPLRERAGVRGRKAGIRSAVSTPPASCR